MPLCYRSFTRLKLYPSACQELQYFHRYYYANKWTSVCHVIVSHVHSHAHKTYTNRLFTSKLQSIEANATLLQEDFSPPAANTTQHLQLVILSNIITKSNLNLKLVCRSVLIYSLCSSSLLHITVNQPAQLFENHTMSNLIEWNRQLLILLLSMICLDFISFIFIFVGTNC